ncbi:type II toxin-antitoxin system RelE/ParE family toxin [Chloroflexota bacterium]
MSYKVLLSATASTTIKQLDQSTARRVLNRIKWLSENFEQIKPIQLKGKYSGLFKFRIGNYRLAYSIDHNKRIINVVYFAHRKDAYR